MKKIISYISVFAIISLMIIIVNDSVSAKATRDKTGKNKEARESKAVAEVNIIPIPATYYIPVTILDPNGTCGAQYCTLTIDAYEASANCQSLSTTLVGTTQYDRGTADYLLQVSTNGSWVEVKITVHGECHYSVNTNYCCVDLSNISTCRLYICP